VPYSSPAGGADGGEALLGADDDESGERGEFSSGRSASFPDFLSAGSPREIPLRNGQESLTIARMPTDDLPETFHVTTDEQLRAVSNLTRHRIMAALRFEPATITQIAGQMGLKKGSSSYHVRLLERAGLVKVVRTRKVRGVTERYYAMAARAIVLPDPGTGGPDVLMRHAVADLEAAPADGERHVQMAHLRLTDEQFAELGARLGALANEYRELSDPSLPDASLVFALFHPAPREQAEGSAK
jgi:DNA-binding transcriptional ArsR family regulator